MESGNFTEPNAKTTEILLYEGLNAKSQNNWPNLKNDIGSINNLLSPFFPAGFYYKTFMWPPKFWEKYEYFIRHAAGLGKSPKEEDPHTYEHYHYHCDVLIVGGGISGMLAASELLKVSNIRILLIEQQPKLGGNSTEKQFEKLLNEHDIMWGDFYNYYYKKNISDILQPNFKKINKNLKIITSTSVFAYMHNNYLLAVQNLNPMLELNKKKLRQIIWKIRAKQVILATGSFERPLVFDNNDRPGIMLANSASKYIEKHNLHLADNAIIFTNNDSAYQTAIDLHNSNTNVQCVVDLREESI